MIIRVDEEYNIVSCIRVGGDKNNPNCYEVDADNIPSEIMDDMFSYKYINEEFVKKSDAESGHIAEAKKHKIQFLSDVCAQTIESGIQIGEDHYSLSYADQINLSKLATQAAMAPSLPIFYHADGQLCRQYTTEEILQISQIAVAWVTYHTTYFNFSKAYINSMSDFNTIAAFKYGMSLDDSTLEQQLETIIATTGISFIQEIPDPFDYDAILHPTRGQLEPPDIPVISDELFDEEFFYDEEVASLLEELPDNDDTIDEGDDSNEEDEPASDP